MLEYSTLGKHVAVDTWGADTNLLNDVNALEGLLTEAAVKCGATVLSVQSKAFEPQGATVLVLLSESHISIHTYPERGFAALDCYTCGETVDPQIAMDFMISVLKPERAFPKVFKRGDGPIEVVK